VKSRQRIIRNCDHAGSLLVDGQPLHVDEVVLGSTRLIGGEVALRTGVAIEVADGGDRSSCERFQSRGAMLGCGVERGLSHVTGGRRAGL
jgi:hypothetical protein